MSLKHSRSYKTFCMVLAFVFGTTFMTTSMFLSQRTFAEDDVEDQEMISNQHFVTIHDGNESLTIKTDAITVSDALKRANINLDSTDIVEPAADAYINSDDFSINIYRSRPVIVTDGIVKKLIMTASYDNRTIVESAGISVYDGDKITVAPNTNLLESSATSIISVSHNGGRTVTETVEIPYEEQTVSDASLNTGTTELRQVGEVGEKQIIYKVKFIDGKEVSREKVSENVTRPAVPRITAVGAKKSVPPEWETCAGYVRAAGVAEADVYTALTLIYRESGCRYDATNASSGAYGIPQALPGSKMASAGADWRTNPVTQIRWMIGYVNGRYGGWSGAWNYWSTHHWY